MRIRWLYGIQWYQNHWWIRNNWLTRQIWSWNSTLLSKAISHLPERFRNMRFGRVPEQPFTKQSMSRNSKNLVIRISYPYQSCQLLSRAYDTTAQRCIFSQSVRGLEIERVVWNWIKNMNLTWTPPWKRDESGLDLSEVANSAHERWVLVAAYWMKITSSKASYMKEV